MTNQELKYIKTTIDWLLENGDFKDTETAYNIAINAINELEKAINKFFCSRCKLPFTKEELQVNDHCCNCGQEM